MRVWTGVIFVLGGVVLSGCASGPPMAYQRVDGGQIAPQQLELDSTVCNGERQKANLSGVTIADGGLVGVAAQIDRNNATKQVERGCMASKGYVLRPVVEAQR